MKKSNEKKEMIILKLKNAKEKKKNKNSSESPTYFNLIQGRHAKNEKKLQKDLNKLKRENQKLKNIQKVNYRKL